MQIIMIFRLAYILNNNYYITDTEKNIIDTETDQDYITHIVREQLATGHKRINHNYLINSEESDYHEKN